MKIRTTEQSIITAVSELEEYRLLDLNTIDGEIIPVYQPLAKELKVEKVGDDYKISYPQQALFFRGLSVLLPELLNSDQMTIQEKVSTESVSFSLEASRNAVMKLENVQYFIQSLAAMGYTTLYLYTEDTYEVEGYPYFGYLRGRYSKEELSAIVDYAGNFGIEVIPAIQTLAHITQLLRWPQMGQVRDDANTLLIDEPATYSLIEAMLKTVKECFPAGKVHLGMDEAYQAGLGQYLEKHGFEDRFSLIARHLQKVLTLVEKYDLQPIIWSDFIYRLLDQEGKAGLYPIDAVIDEKKSAQLPEHLTYIHWDYGGENLERYTEVIKRHLQFSDLENYVYAGGSHIYGSMSPNHGKTYGSTSVGLQAAAQLGVKHVMLTTWGDDGQEISHWHALPDMYAFANQVYRGEPSTQAQLDQGFDHLFGRGSYDLLHHARKLDEVDGVEEGNYFMANPSKYLLWQDPLLGIYDQHVVSYNQTGKLSKYYHQLSEHIKKMNVDPNRNIITKIQEQYAKLADILKDKGELGVDLRTAYLSEDAETLKQFAKEIIPQLAEKIDQLRELHQDIWFATYKPNGWETLDIRYGGLITRLKSTQKRLEAYLQGDIQEIPELQEEKLLFTKGTTPLSINSAKYGDIANIGYYN